MAFVAPFAAKLPATVENDAATLALCPLAKILARLGIDGAAFLASPGNDQAA